MPQDKEKALDALLGIGCDDQASFLSHNKLWAIYGEELPDPLLQPICALVTVTSSPAGLIYFYIKNLGMTLHDWCYPSVDPSWYCAVDTHYRRALMLEERDLRPNSYRLIDEEVLLCPS